MIQNVLLTKRVKLRIEIELELHEHGRDLDSIVMQIEQGLEEGTREYHSIAAALTIEARKIAMDDPFSIRTV